MDFLILIKNGCDNLTATVAPSVDSLGLHMVIALATIMLVWFGVQEALASAQGGPGFNIAKFLNFFLLITFAYCFVRFYDGAIPGIGYSLKGFISGGTSSLVDHIGNDSTQEVQDAIHNALGQVGALSPSLTEPYTLLCTYTVQIVLSVLTALIAVIIAYGAIGATIIGLLGPVFIPWMVFGKTDFLFWGWLKTFLGFEFYKVVAAATMSVMSHLLITELASLIHPSAPQQRSGVLASLSLVADSFRLLPKKEDAAAEWTAREWSKERKGWIFLTSQPAEREALRPLHSLWIDMLVLRLLSAPKPEQHPVWFVLDELASLQKLPQLHTAITENRKSRNPIVLGFQGKAQLEVVYGHLAEVMLSQPATKIFLKTTEPIAAEWVSRAIGKVEIERMKETHFDGTRSGKNFSLDRQTEPLVLDSEISDLENLHAFLKHGNYVTRFSFPVLELPATQPKFIERLKDDFIVRELKDKPETAASRPAAPSEPAAPSPVSEESQRPFIVHQRNTAQAQQRQEQAVLPFNTEL